MWETREYGQFADIFAQNDSKELLCEIGDGVRRDLTEGNDEVFLSTINKLKEIDEWLENKQKLVLENGSRDFYFALTIYRLDSAMNN